MIFTQNSCILWRGQKEAKRLNFYFKISKSSYLASKKPIYQPWAEIEELLDASSFLLFLSARSYTKLRGVCRNFEFWLSTGSELYIYLEQELQSFGLWETEWSQDGGHWRSRAMKVLFKWTMTLIKFSVLKVTILVCKSKFVSKTKSRGGHSCYVQ
jgi:hypothetical protein